MQMSVEYGDVIKAYQNKVSELINQLITAEAKLIACENIIQKYEQKTEELEKKFQNLPLEFLRNQTLVML